MIRGPGVEDEAILPKHVRPSARAVALLDDRHLVSLRLQADRGGEAPNPLPMMLTIFDLCVGCRSAPPLESPRVPGDSKAAEIPNPRARRKRQSVPDISRRVEYRRVPDCACGTAQRCESSDSVEMLWEGAVRTASRARDSQCHQPMPACIPAPARGFQALRSGSAKTSTAPPMAGSSVRHERLHRRRRRC